MFGPGGDKVNTTCIGICRNSIWGSGNRTAATDNIETIFLLIAATVLSLMMICLCLCVARDRETRSRGLVGTFSFVLAAVASITYGAVRVLQQIDYDICTKRC